MKATKAYLLFIAFLAANFIIPNKTIAQCDCAYPIIFVHGWNSDVGTFGPVYTDADFVNIWGALSDSPDAVLNATAGSHAYGTDETKLTGDDDMLFHLQFVNRSALAPGCIYATDWDWQWDENTNNPTITTNGSFPNTSSESDSNQSSAEKQGYALGETIKAVLAANPTKKKVILMGHSMGGLASREYLQRVENGVPTWWVDPSDPVNGHKVAKVITAGTPHRGSNASGGGIGVGFGFDEQSEAVRDLRFSYYAGFFSARNRAPYLFGGSEDPHATDATRDNYDIDCDGDVDTNPIVSLNAIGVGDPWDGAGDNPDMPLPTNIKYTYYSSYSVIGLTFNDGDGVVDLERQWIYTGGNGRLDNYENGTSIPVPFDGVNYRLSDRIHSEENYFHTSQTGDVNNMARLLDEGDYPYFAFDINTGVDYAGMSQMRADFVPTDSEYSGGANSIDGDWFVFETTEDAPGFDITMTPNINKAGRIDFYETTPSSYDNTNAPTYTNTWQEGQDAFVLTATDDQTCFSAGTYYVRITHEGLSNTDWREPYKFRVDPQTCRVPSQPLAIDITELSATLTWAASPCATQYILEWREVGTTTWTNVSVTGTTHELTTLLPNTDYEFQVQTDCGSSTSIYTAIIPFSTIACPQVLYIPSNIETGRVTEGIYDVDVSISSDGYVDPSTVVTYYAGNFIDLLPGFEVGLGAEFLADIQTCTANFTDETIIANRSTIDENVIVATSEPNASKEAFVSWKEALKQQEDLYFRIVPLTDGSMKLEYYLDENRTVNIEITNSLNEYVTTIIAHKKETKGWHSTIFDTKTLTPDVYLVDFRADGLHRSDKIALGSKVKETLLTENLLENNVVANTQVEVYPNPFSNVLSVTLETLPLVDGFILNLFDVTGKLVKTIELQDVTQNISTKHLETGFYFYKIENKEGLEIGHGRLVKK